jgi:hypothetical protein
MSALLAAFTLGTLAAPAVLLIQRSDALAARRARLWQARQTTRNYKHERARMNERHAEEWRELRAGFYTARREMAKQHRNNLARLARTYGKVAR